MLTVKQVADLFEVTPMTIRSWDTKGILKPERVSPTGRRYYSEERVNQVLNGVSTQGKETNNETDK